MLNVRIVSGALYYGTPRRRYDVPLDDALRRETEAVAARLHELTRARQTPRATYEKKCDRCSLYELCLPKTTGGQRSARAYLSGIIDQFATPDAGE